MTLNRQKILNELGSVMNQLKSTDCGCMGKLFGDSGQSAVSSGNTPSCGYSNGCCHSHGQYPNSYSGHSTNNVQNMHRSCMGQCNPSKLYSDTYNYLTENLMQPTINEVYNELKTITPENTIMNNPMANQLGLAQKHLGAQNIGNSNADNTYTTNHVPHCTTPANNLNSNQMDRFGGMGPQIMNMLGETNTLKQNNMQQQDIMKQQPYPNLANTPEYQNNAPESYNNDLAIRNQTYHANQPNNMNLNPQAQQQNSNKYHLHGNHAQGIAKFKEMFPGVVKNDDLGFDPMSIAIQMNPANQKQVAMETIHKMINNNDGCPNKNRNTTNGHPDVNIPSNINNYAIPNQTGDSTVPQLDVLQQKITTNQVNQPTGAIYGESQIVPQHAHTYLNNQQFLQNQQPNIQTEPQESNKTVFDVRTIPVVKEPIFPADKSRFVMSMPKEKYEYNTLGQPVEMLPAKMYHTPEPGLPQTLSPQSTVKPKNDFTKYSNVKSTMSKTAITGLNAVGRIPSRNQLQQIYNNYKGSHSCTHQNVSPTRKEASRSDRQINMHHPQENFVDHIIERVGGDTLHNPETNERIHKMENIIGQIGDVPLTNKSNSLKMEEKVSPIVNRKCRNGLQDVVYTSYPTSTSWSFHGDGRASCPTGRYHNKI